MIIDVALLNALYSVRVFGKQTIAKHIAKRLNVTVRTALRRINRLENEEGLKFSIEYSLRALKLKRVAIFTTGMTDTSLYDIIKLKNVVPFIRSIMTLLPLGLGLVYHLPKDVPIDSLEIPSDAQVIEYQEFFRNMTDLNIYPLRALYDARLASSDEILNKLRKRLINLFQNEIMQHEKGINMDIEHEFLLSSSKFDWIDLMIIKELEKNPFIGLEALSKKLNMPMSRVRRHLFKHVSKINRGIRIRKMPYDRSSDVVKLIIILKLKDVKLAYAVINELIRCPLIIVCGLNVNSGEVLVQAIPSVVDVRRVVRFFDDLGKELGFDFRGFFIAVSSRSYTVPFIRDKEYTPAVGWRFKERSS